MRHEVEKILKIWDGGEWEKCSGTMAGAIAELRKSFEQPVAWRADHKDGNGWCYYDERWPAEFIPQTAEPLYK